MADYKVVDTEQLETDLTSIAAAIREKAESSESLVFPTGFISAIANIETGGGLPNHISALTSGSTTFSSDSTTYKDVYHNLGVIPNFVVWYIADSLSENQENLMVAGFSCAKKLKGNNGTIYRHHVGFTGFGIMGNIYGGSYYEQTDPNTKLMCRLYATGEHKLKAGYTYGFICGVLDNIN